MAMDGTGGGLASATSVKGGGPAMGGTSSGPAMGNKVGGRGGTGSAAAKTARQGACAGAPAMGNTSSSHAMGDTNGLKAQLLSLAISSACWY
jgi:hypothetical protein